MQRVRRNNHETSSIPDPGGSLALSLAACGSSASSSVAASSAAATTLTGKGNGFGGVITATVTMEGDTITAVSFDGPDETENVGGAALSTLAEQIVAANGTEIDGVSGATYTTNGCKAAVLNAIDPDANPYEEDSAEKTEWPTGASRWRSPQAATSSWLPPTACTPRVPIRTRMP